MAGKTLSLCQLFLIMGRRKKTGAIQTRPKLELCGDGLGLGLGLGLGYNFKVWNMTIMQEPSPKYPTMFFFFAGN